MLERITCQIKPNPGPVNRMDPVAAQRIKKARINRVRCFKTGFVFIGQMMSGKDSLWFLLFAE